MASVGSGGDAVRRSVSMKINTETKITPTGDIPLGQQLRQGRAVQSRRRVHSVQLDSYVRAPFYGLCKRQAVSAVDR